MSVLVQPAAGQTTPTYQPGACNSVQDLGTMTVGQTRTFTLTPTPTACLFNGSVSKTVNGVPVGTETASGGSVTVIVNAVSETQLSIDDPVITPATIGTNRIVATGTSANNVAVTHTATFTLLRVGTDTTTPGPGGVLSKTGSNVFRWSVAAAVLIAVGAFFVFADRRRHRVRD